MFDDIIRDNLTYDDQEEKMDKLNINDLFDLQLNKAKELVPMKRYPKAKHTSQIVLRCMSCGAPIRIGQKYHCLHVKGQPWAFCKLCVGLSEYTAQKEVKK